MSGNSYSEKISDFWGCAGYLVRPFWREIVCTYDFSLQDPRRATCKEKEMQGNSMVWPNIVNPNIVWDDGFVPVLSLTLSARHTCRGLAIMDLVLPSCTRYDVSHSGA